MTGFKQKKAGRYSQPLHVHTMRFELTRPCGHYPLKVACLPIPPRVYNYFKQKM